MMVMMMMSMIVMLSITGSVCNNGKCMYDDNEEIAIMQSDIIKIKNRI